MWNMTWRTLGHGYKAKQKINRICTCSWSSTHSHSARSRHTLVHSVPWCDASTHVHSRLVTSTPSFRPRCWLAAFGPAVWLSFSLSAWVWAHTCQAAFIGTVVAPRSPRLVKTKACNITAWARLSSHTAHRGSHFHSSMCVTAAHTPACVTRSTKLQETS